MRPMTRPALEKLASCSRQTTSHVWSWVSNASSGRLSRPVEEIVIGGSKPRSARGNRINNSKIDAWLNQFRQIRSLFLEFNKHRFVLGIETPFLRDATCWCRTRVLPCAYLGGHPYS